MDIRDVDVNSIIPTVVDATAVVLQTQNPIGAASGRVYLQGRVDHSDAQVELGDGATITDSTGRYALTAAAGTQTLRVTKTGYLPAQQSGVPIAIGGFYAVPRVSLAGGDVNDDGAINLFDLVFVAAHFADPPSVAPRADINEDASVDVLDVVMVATNYGKRGTQAAFTTKAAPAEEQHKAAAPIARVSLDAPTWVKAGEEFKATVRVRNAHDLFGAQVALGFDPRQVSLIDIDDEHPGGQGMLGDLLPNAYVAANKADRGGTFTFAATRLAPDEAVSGDGVLVTLLFRARASGDPGLHLTSARLVDADAAQLPSLVTTK